MKHAIAGNTFVTHLRRWWRLYVLAALIAVILAFQSFGGSETDVDLNSGDVRRRVTLAGFTIYSSFRETGFSRFLREENLLPDDPERNWQAYQMQGWDGSRSCGSAGGAVTALEMLFLLEGQGLVSREDAKPHAERLRQMLQRGEYEEVCKYAESVWESLD